MTTSNNFLPNIQVYPAKNFKIAVDNPTRQMFEMCIEGKEEISFDLVESHLKNLKSSVKISNLNSLSVKFTEFEYAVFNSTISERIAENDYTTAAILARHLGAWQKPSTKFQQVIIDSLDKLAAIRIIDNLDGTAPLLVLTDKMIS